MRDDLNQIVKDLQEYPHHIHMAAIAAEDLRAAWDTLKVQRDYEYSAAFLKAKASDFTDGEARQQATVEVYETDKLALAAESSYRRAEADLKKMENEFTAVRKQANLIEADMQTIGRHAA